MKSKVKPKSFKGLVQRFRHSKAFPYISNRYTMTSFAFLVWMVVFDDNTVIQQVKRRYDISQQTQKISYYQQEIEKVDVERDALFGDPAALEKFARERYRMHKDGEDIYLVIHK